MFLVSIFKLPWVEGLHKGEGVCSEEKVASQFSVWNITDLGFCLRRAEALTHGRWVQVVTANRKFSVTCDPIRDKTRGNAFKPHTAPPPSVFYGVCVCVPTSACGHMSQKHYAHDRHIHLRLSRAADAEQPRAAEGGGGCKGGGGLWRCECGGVR